MTDNRQRLFVADEGIPFLHADGSGHEAVVQASLDGALEDLLLAAVETGSEPYAVSCARIDQTFDVRMAPHRHLTWARLLAEGLKMQLKLGLHRHVSATVMARENYGSQRVDVAAPSL